MTTDTTKHLEALESIKRKLRGRTLSYKEIYNLMDEIAQGRMSEVLTAYFVASGFKDGFSPAELYHLTKAMVETGTKLHFPGIVADKHSIGGLSGTRASMIIVPIVVAAGFIMPKTSSRAITSPAGTADVMEVLAKVELEPHQIEKIIGEVGGCIVWGGRLGIAPADDILIRVEEPLSFESFDKIIVSIMAKKIAVSANHLVLDIPAGRTMKVKYTRDAELVAQKFRDICAHFKIKVDIDINHASEPAGNGIGPYLEAIDVMKVLSCTSDRPEALEQRAIRLAGRLLNLCYETKGLKLDGHEEAKKILHSGEALKVFRRIIEAQQGDSSIEPHTMKMKGFTKEVHSDRSGTIKRVNNYHLSAICKILGAPADKYAGIYIHSRIGKEVRTKDVIMDLHSSAQSRLKEAIDTLNAFPIFTIE